MRAEVIFFAEYSIILNLEIFLSMTVYRNKSVEPSLSDCLFISRLGDIKK